MFITKGIQKFNIIPKNRCNYNTYTKQKETFKINPIYPICGIVLVPMWAGALYEYKYPKHEGRSLLYKLIDGSALGIGTVIRYGLPIIGYIIISPIVLPPYLAIKIYESINKK